MSARNGIVLLVALSTLLFLAACGGGGGSPATPIPPPSGSFSNSNLSGTYVFSVSGVDFNGAPYAILGTFIANGSGGTGKGGITGGAVDIVDSEFTPTYNLSINNNGFYSVGTDGRGELTIGTSTTNPFNSNLTFDFVLSSSSHGLITEFDGNASGSGTIDLQTAGVTQASLAGSYAYSFSGVDAAGSGSFASVGAFTLDASGNATGVADFNDADLPYANQPLSGKVLLGPSSTPSTTLTTTSFPLTYDVYAIDSTHLKFIEIGALPILSGDAYSQTSAAIPTGTLAFTLAGDFASAPSAFGGFLVTDGAGNITTSSSEDINEGGSVVSTAPESFSGTYTNSGSLITARSTLTLTGFTGGTEYVAYPYAISSSSQGLLLLEIDSGGIMVGGASVQTSGATLAASQGYGLNLSGLNLGGATGSDEEVDDIAEFTTVSGGTLTGIIDENYAPGGVPVLGIALSNTAYSSLDSQGRYGITATAANNNTGTLNGGFALTAYAVDGTTFPFIESDSGQVATGVFVLQSPSSSSSSVAHSHAFVVRPLIRPHGDWQKKKN
jgi:hypothetical protein